MKLSKIQALVLLVVLLTVPLIMMKYLEFHEYSLLSIYSSSESLKDFILSFGDKSEVIFILVQALQVILAPIPGEFTGTMAGYLFGGLHGAFLATCGLALGSMIAFMLGRWIGKPIVEIMVKAEDIEKYTIKSDRKKLIVIFIVFLIPGFPKDVITYVLSLGKINAWSFFAVSQLGRVPGTFMLTYGADALFSKNWYLVGFIVVLTIAMIATAFFYKQKIYNWLKSE